MIADDYLGWVPVGLCGNAGSDGLHAHCLPRVLLQCAHGGGGGRAGGEGVKEMVEKDQISGVRVSVVHMETKI